MKIKKLRLDGFRNYDHLSIEPSPYINIIYGPNASGKTNILEAISMLLSGRSFRTHRDRETINHDRDQYIIEALINIRGLDKDYQMSYSRTSSKDIKVNLSTVASLRELRRDSPLVTFIPEDLEIIKKSPSNRRKFIDDGISSIDLIYRYNLQKYTQILRDKNDLLKYRRTTLDQDLLLDTYNIQLASLSAFLIDRRTKYIRQLKDIGTRIHRDIADDEDMDIIYTNPHKDITDIKALEGEIFKELTELKSTDLQRGRSTTGPQRDDYDIIIDGHKARDYGSQGQQRNLVLSLKFAQLEILKNSKDISPILLLDDVFSELDIYRRSRLIEYIKDMQVFITMAEKKYLDEFDNIDSNIYYVKDKNVSLIDGGNNGR